ncbi:MAG: hydroxylamine reductase [Phycisphaerae bacterium]
MFCYQCQEAAHNEGCVIKGVCGKSDEIAGIQDVLIDAAKGLAIWAAKAKAMGQEDRETGRLISEALFATITNVNFDHDSLLALIGKVVARRELVRRKFLDEYQRRNGKAFQEKLDSAATWVYQGEASVRQRMLVRGLLQDTTAEGRDVTSLKQLILYGLKGMAAYADHAAILGFEDPGIYDFMVESLATLTTTPTVPELLALAMRTGEYSVKTMALLDTANTSRYGHPGVTEVNIGVGTRPGILISGHDLRDMQQLLEQTENTGVDVYTHGEMLPAHYYPAFKKYKHLAGNYGGAWWQQGEEFELFNGPIIMTTNCIIPVKESYRARIFTTGMVGYPGVKHIAENHGHKDFSAVIALAKQCPPPQGIESGKIVGGFAHQQLEAFAGPIVDAVKSGAIKRFVVMAGCDGRSQERKYYTHVAESLPPDTVILTAGCAKYRYNKLNLGTIGGIPRVLDAGQCNDSYSLAVIALKLKEIFKLDDINDLPLSFDIAWYEQKAVTVLLALLYLGVKGLRLGPTLPAFLSPDVIAVLVEKFKVKPIGEAQSDVAAMMAGR